MILSFLLSYVSNYGGVKKDELNPLVVVFLLLIPVILFGTYFFYLRYKQKHKIVHWLGKSFPISYSDFSLKEVQIVLAVAMVKRDRYLLMNKLHKMKQFSQKKYSSRELDVEEIMDVFLDSKIPVMELMEWCNKHISDFQKLETFLFLSEIALLDNQLIDKEREYLLFIIQKFTIRIQDVPDHIQSQIFDRHQNKESIKPSVFSYHSYYEVLELTKDASSQEIKTAYRKMVKKYHPDSHPHLESGEKKELAKKFQEVQEAYDTLMNA
ncbi:J domain-containing protein [Fluviicola taffensis]|uniref:Heat shock protein DnaJ domain protein n=1 Tax=Fluviicola taffensis (strain DSM 16823 / NCIMB 13979 / RW262) TaxID=755732 RepID=F2IBS4_FLUTR|nr:DnaJ domain-containing protein [Fluviicola taffensis]AEA45400.1 heat shock protein DnaJ domain protein [Fluviicola taffensis DSM 16823]